MVDTHVSDMKGLEEYPHLNATEMAAISTAKSFTLTVQGKSSIRSAPETGDHANDT